MAAPVINTVTPDKTLYEIVTIGGTDLSVEQFGFDFDGSTYITTNADVIPTGNVSFMFSLRTDLYSGRNGIGWTVAVAGVTNRFYIQTVGDDLYMGYGNNSCLCSTLTDNTIYHLAFSVSSGVVSTYINGLFLTSFTATFDNNKKEDLQLFLSQTSDFIFSRFDTFGVVYDVKIFDSALTQQQIQSEITQNNIQTIGFWSLNQNTFDTSGNGNDGIVTGTEQYTQISAPSVLKLNGNVKTIDTVTTTELTFFADPDTDPLGDVDVTVETSEGTDTSIAAYYQFKYITITSLPSLVYIGQQIDIDGTSFDEPGFQIEINGSVVAVDSLIDNGGNSFTAKVTIPYLDCNFCDVTALHEKDSFTLENGIKIETIPILLGVNNVKVYPDRILEISGINFSGDVAVKIGDIVEFISGNKSDTSIVIKSPVNLHLGKIELKISKFSINGGVPEFGTDSNIIYMYSYANIQTTIDDYCTNYNNEQYTEGVVDLIPPGKFAREDNSNNWKLNSVVADQLVDINAQICDISVETNPLITDQLLSDWEIELGLPEPCISNQNQDLEARKQEVRRKYLSTGGNTAVYFEQMAALIGYTIQIEENTATLKNCESNCEAAVVDPSVLFVINVLVFGVEQKIRNCESNCEAAIDWFGGEEIECFLNQLKPAHNIINIKYRIGSVLTTDDEKTIVTDEDKEILATF